MAETWGNVSAIVIRDPRMKKADWCLEKLKNSVTELFEKHPVEDTKIMMVKNQNDPLYHQTRKFREALGLIAYDNLGDVPFNELIKVPGRLMFDDTGKCTCGRRVFLFCQCAKCLEAELHGKHVKHAEQLHEGEPEATLIGALQGPLPGDLTNYPRARSDVTQAVYFITVSELKRIVSQGE